MVSQVVDWYLSNPCHLIHIEWRAIIFFGFLNSLLFWFCRVKYFKLYILNRYEVRYLGLKNSKSYLTINKINRLGQITMMNQTDELKQTTRIRFSSSKVDDHVKMQFEMNCMCVYANFGYILIYPFINLAKSTRLFIFPVFCDIINPTQWTKH